MVRHGGHNGQQTNRQHQSHTATYKHDTVDSMTTRLTMLPLVAPKAFRTPISLVRSLTPMARMFATPQRLQEGPSGQWPK